MFAEIVPEQLRSVVYAFDRSFEGAIAACAAPLVGGLLNVWHLSSWQISLHSDKHAHSVLTAMHKACRRICWLQLYHMPKFAKSCAFFLHHISPHGWRLCRMVETMLQACELSMHGLCQG